jgi:AcrR family transcriptional regulator
MLLTQYCVSRNMQLRWTTMATEPGGPSSCGGGAACAGWRERKKLATREAISLAALRLAIEHGLENVRVGDIAARAGVSPRTYNNYFSSREEAICAVGADRAWRMVASLRARPPSEPLAEALRHAMVDDHDVVEPDKAVLRLIVCHPSLRGEFFRATSGVHRELAEAIAERTGHDAERELLPGVVGSAYQAAWRASIMYWLKDDNGRSLGSVLQEAFAALAPLADALERQRVRRSPLTERPAHRPENANPTPTRQSSASFSAAGARGGQV